MINLIIWSKDRAAQLELLLRSIQVNAAGLFRPYIIYVASNQNYRDAYNVVKASHFMNDIQFIEEKDFEADTKKIIQQSELIAFSTDDTVIYRKIEKPEVVESVARKDEVVTFSLRYGLNTLVQDIHRNLNQPALNLYNDHGDYITWPHFFYHPHSNYGYPFGLDMHVYKADRIFNYMRDFSFANSNQLESALFNKRVVCPPQIASFKQSVAVNIPANTVSGITRAGEKYKWDLESVNEEFLKGKRIDLVSIMSEDIIGCHQEVKLEWLTQKKLK